MDFRHWELFDIERTIFLQVDFVLNIICLAQICFVLAEFIIELTQQVLLKKIFPHLAWAQSIEVWHLLRL
jgi:hypothetical protein